MNVNYQDEDAEVIIKQLSKLQSLKTHNFRLNLYKIFQEKSIFASNTLQGFLATLNSESNLTIEEIRILTDIDILGFYNPYFSELSLENVANIELELNTFKQFIVNYNGEYNLDSILETYPCVSSRVDIIEQAFIISVWESKDILEVLSQLSKSIDILKRFHSTQLFNDLTNYAILSRAIDSDSDEIKKIQDDITLVNLLHYPNKSTLKDLIAVYSQRINEVKQNDNSIRQFGLEYKKKSQISALTSFISKFGDVFIEDMFNLISIIERLRNNKDYKQLILNSSCIDIDLNQILTTDLIDQVQSSLSINDVINTLRDYYIKDLNISSTMKYLLFRIFGQENEIIDELGYGFEVILKDYENWKSLFIPSFYLIYLTQGHSLEEFLSQISSKEDISYLSQQIIARLNIYIAVLNRLINLSDSEYISLVHIRNQNLLSVANKKYKLSEIPTDHLGCVYSILDLAKDLKIEVENSTDISQDQIIFLFELVSDVSLGLCNSYNIDSNEYNWKRNTSEQLIDPAIDSTIFNKYLKYQFLFELISSLGVVFLSDATGNMYIYKSYLHVIEQYFYGWDI